MFGGKKGGFRMQFRRRKTAQPEAINKFPTSPIKMASMFGGGDAKDKPDARAAPAPFVKPTRVASPQPVSPSPKPKLAASPKPSPAKPTIAARMPSPKPPQAPSPRPTVVQAPSPKPPQAPSPRPVQAQSPRPAQAPSPRAASPAGAVKRVNAARAPAQHASPGRSPVRGGSPKPTPADAEAVPPPIPVVVAAIPAKPQSPKDKPEEAVVEPEVSVNPDAATLDVKNKLLLRNQLRAQARALAQAKVVEDRKDPAKARHDIISVPEKKLPAIERVEPEVVKQDDDVEADVATVKKGPRAREPRPAAAPTEFDVPSVEPIQPLKLDGARAAKIPHFMSAWFNPEQQKAGAPAENRDPNKQAPAAPAAPAKEVEREVPAVENVVSIATGKDSRTPGLAANSQNIKYTEIRLGRMIGEGAFGKVYEGKWRGRAVAVKVLVCQDLRSDILHEFQSEVEIMSVLRHPNICRLLGACLDPPNRALVVELMQRGSLWGVLRTHRKSLDMDMRTRFIYDTAKGMAYLHHFERPILHRDLKSPNLLVDKNYNIKLSDFGLARVKAHVQTMTGNCGTVQWMAPEVLGNQKYTEKADVFSFGIVIWEVMTGECPYDGMSQIQAALGVLNRNLRPTIPKQCPPFFSRLMKACWNRQPELRPSFPHIVSAFRTYQTSLSETRATSSAAASANAAVAAASVAAA